MIDGVVVYPKETRCSMVGGMCVESDKCRSLVSAKGMCPQNQHRGVECCFEREFSLIFSDDKLANLLNFLFSGTAVCALPAAALKKNRV